MIWFAIVGGGSSDIDFKSFNDYNLAQAIALFLLFPYSPALVATVMTSISDLVARQHKTPTEVATYIIDNIYEF
ncbi:MAG: hypothetical protein IPP29_13080 [Bacteroidetes bacterium]|nr:hypothetical protein [Bacteroidota bacterium]